jgi:DNA-binding NtrC family response regulator
MNRRPQPALSDEARAILLRYMWPGNIRELRNVIERAVLLCTDVILLEHLPVEKMGTTQPSSMAPPPLPAARGSRDSFAPLRPTRLEGASPSAPPPPPEPSGSQLDLKSEVEALERQRIIDALERCAGNQTKAAKMLGMSRRSFLTRLETYNLPRPRKGAS